MKTISLTTGALVQTRRVLPSAICTPDSEVVLNSNVGLLAHAVRIADGTNCATRTVPRGRIITAIPSSRVVRAVENVACRRHVCGRDQRCGEEDGRD
jgi:hypothetical protein